MSLLTEYLETRVKRVEQAMLDSGGYMPALATLLRIIADEYADKYPDDTNGGGDERLLVSDAH